MGDGSRSLSDNTFTDASVPPLRRQLHDNSDVNTGGQISISPRLYKNIQRACGTSTAGSDIAQSLHKGEQNDLLKRHTRAIQSQEKAKKTKDVTKPQEKKIKQKEKRFALRSPVTSISRNEDAPSTVAVATASPPASPLPLAADITNFLLNHCELASTLLTCYTRAEESEKLHVFISYLHVFVHNRVEQRLIEHHIQREASLCFDSATLFRENSAAAILVSQFLRIKGISYIRKIVTPLLKVIVEDGYSNLEVDPNRCPDTSQRDLNSSKLMDLVGFFFEDIFSSLKMVPSIFKVLFQNLVRIVEAKFPAVKLEIVGGFFFLRFLCPAIISPERFKINITLDRGSRRTVVLISKILQNLSNGIFFGLKEDFMVPFNTVITNCQEKMKHFLSSISTSCRQGSYYMVRVSEVCVSSFKEKLPFYLLSHVMNANLQHPDDNFGFPHVSESVREVVRALARKWPDAHSSLVEDGFSDITVPLETLLMEIEKSEKIGFKQIPKESPTPPSSPESELEYESQLEMVPKALLTAALKEKEELKKELRKVQLLFSSERENRAALQLLLVRLADNLEAQVQQRLDIRLKILLKQGKIDTETVRIILPQDDTEEEEEEEEVFQSLSEEHERRSSLHLLHQQHQHQQQQQQQQLERYQEQPQQQSLLLCLSPTEPIPELKQSGSDGISLKKLHRRSNSLVDLKNFSDPQFQSSVGVIPPNVLKKSVDLDLGSREAHNFSRPLKMFKSGSASPIANFHTISLSRSFSGEEEEVKLTPSPSSHPVSSRGRGGPASGRGVAASQSHQLYSPSLAPNPQRGTSRGVNSSPTIRQHSPSNPSIRGNFYPPKPPPTMKK